LFLAKDLGLMSKEWFQQLQERLTEVMRMLSSLAKAEAIGPKV